MTPLLKTLLTVHVLLGLVGVITSFMVTYLLIKPDIPKRFLRNAALVSLLSFIISWVAGGKYYLMYYGSQVKPLILKGKYPWAHTVFTESKEHLFLVLPFAALVILLIVWLKADSLGSDHDLRSRTMKLSLVTTAIGIIITLSGVLITGGS